MSSVMRPSGPLPSRVYWYRRLFALAVLGLTIAILWWCVQKVTGNADDGGASNEPAATSASSPPAGVPAGSVDSAPREGRGDADKQTRKDKKKTRLVAPTGGCDVTAIAMTIEVSDVKEGKSVPIKLMMTTEPGTACTQAITPSTLVLRITSGKDVVWSSDDCPDKLRAAEVVVRADPAGVYGFEWNGRRSTGSCAGTGALAAPGGYWVEAALIGADSHTAFFDVTDG